MKSFCISSLTLLLLSILSIHAQDNFRVVSPEQLKPTIFEFLDDHRNLSDTELSKSLKEYLVAQGYTFVQVSVSKTAGVTTLQVKPGFMGKAKVAGNEYLDEDGILDHLDWETGQPFNYSKFYNQTSRLNRYRFVQVDSKLKPVRGHDGEIQVNADFNVEDQLPLSPYISISNDGTEQSSGWRTRVGLEIWENFMPNDRLNLSYSLDPKDASQLSSYFASYQFGSSDFTQTVYAGYSDSEYENVTSSTLNMDIAGDGFFAGYSAVYPIGLVDPNSLAVSFGFSYLDLSSQIFLGNNKLLASDEDLTLFLPRIGLQGKFANPFGLRGDGFWSLGAVSDLSSSDDNELNIQNPELEKGFWVPKVSFAIVEPVEFLGAKGGIKFKLDGQASSEPLPTSLKKSIGGIASVRGYREREAYGDTGMSMSLEYSMMSEKTSIFGLDGNVQNIFFYDAGYVSNEGVMASVNDSTGMQSFGAGLIGNFDETADISLQVGVPLADTLNTPMHDARTHFSINFRF
jgi:hemolysin activation/secretion protein